MNIFRSEYFNTYIFTQLNLSNHSKSKEFVCKMGRKIRNMGKHLKNLYVKMPPRCVYYINDLLKLKFQCAYNATDRVLANWVCTLSKDSSKYAWLYIKTTWLTVCHKCQYQQLLFQFVAILVLCHGTHIVCVITQWYKFYFNSSVLFVLCNHWGHLYNQFYILYTYSERSWNFIEKFFINLYKNTIIAPLEKKTHSKHIINMFQISIISSFIRAIWQLQHVRNSWKFISATVRYK